MSTIVLPIILLMIIVLLISLTLIFYYYKIRKAVNRKPVSGKRTSTAKLDNDVVFNISQQISCSQFTSFPLPTILENQVSDGTNDQDYTAMHSSCNHIYEDATKI
ncbi:PREDICTED: uncharacterized protein LOC109590468 isoform X2 [Amphimedon queenslandica]|uniref:Uncharacterized protein n=1 Tax=Amphimedon queenslandica TaxID=400682 RepID=A0AAN0JXM4_AMPQE|nr:PREDICTED: uncharacterized protein LOC109590468 isoform X2 [Amphimedon queenslandica]|eukprot:XP_019861946.1 PREDICTED: uncharacterized protein LOC109590468 isoform X2 [Amphimedon queenslandica]